MNKKYFVVFLFVLLVRIPCLLGDEKGFNLPKGYFGELYGLNEDEKYLDSIPHYGLWGYRHTPFITGEYPSLIFERLSAPSEKMVRKEKILKYIKDETYRNRASSVGDASIEFLSSHGIKDLQGKCHGMAGISEKGVEKLEENNMLPYHNLASYISLCKFFLERDDNLMTNDIQKNIRRWGNSDVFRLTALMSKNEKSNKLLYDFWGCGDPTGIYNKIIQFLRQNYAGVNSEFKKKYNADLPLHEVRGASVKDTAKRIKFWRYFLDKVTYYRKSCYLSAKEELKRQGIENIIMCHPHGKDMVYPKMYWETTDAIHCHTCPGIIPDKLGRMFCAGYSTRLLVDLCHKPMMQGVYCGMFNFTSSYVPTPGSIRMWYDQVIQNGSYGIYIWPRDFRAEFTLPENTVIKEYGGTGLRVKCVTFKHSSPVDILGNERWNTVFNISQELSKSKVFIPPKSEIGVFVSIDSTLVKGWGRIFSSYIELRKSDVWINFLSDDGVLAGKEKLEDYKVIIIPQMVFQNRKIIEMLKKYVEKGGIIVACNPEVFLYDDNGNSLSDQRNKLFGVKEIIKREKKGLIKIQEQYSSARIKSYGEQYKLVLSEGAKAIGSYTDDKNVAVSLHKHGKGEAIFCGFNLADEYRLYDGKHPKDKGRYKFYKFFENKLGIENNSWIYSVTINDIYNLSTTR